jgi:mannose/fructose/N-acetylgalactosamine-specific phosphotransferase system component IIB
VRRYLILSNLQCHELSFRFKSGPMGPSILTSHLCALAIKSNVEHYQILLDYCLITKSYDLIRLFEQSVDLCIVNVGNLHMLITGKISLASEPAGKTRLFAICNF